METVQSWWRWLFAHRAEIKVVEDVAETVVDVAALAISGPQPKEILKVLQDVEHIAEDVTSVGRCSNEAPTVLDFALPSGEPADPPGETCCLP